MNGFTDTLSIQPDHATWNVTRTVLIQIFAGCITISSYRLYSNTKRSANDSANAFYQGCWIMYVLQKAHYKDARERQQQVIVAYCWLSLFLGDLSFIAQKN